MAEYIERAAAVKVILRERKPTNSVAQNRMLSIIQRDLLTMCAADVAPVVYGRWVHLGGDEWCCSACGFVITTEGSWDKPTKKYCEDCGAKMEQETR
nr:MAG TPA: Rubredoxin loop, ELECTRON TRANSPORT [Caudoviricetes sp.]